MESVDVIIARLVLGYLKEEKCRSSYREFLKSSHHLHDHKIASTKYIPTRFLGLTLGDILTEYFEISQIVQGRLESTSYYDEQHVNNSLMQQVLYLLNKLQSSRASTPCPSSCRSPSEIHSEDSPHREHISDVETTPAHTLPGNVHYESEESSCHKTPRRNEHKYDNCLDSYSVEVEQDHTPEFINTEELAKTLLDNTEFHEKIARTINKVAEKKHRVSAELDKTVKTVVKETERDPIFDKILDEIIGSSGLIENNKELATSSFSSTESIGNKNKKTCENNEQNSNVSNEICPVDQGIQQVHKTTNGTCVEQQNLDNQDQNEVMVFNGPLEKYIGSTTNISANNVNMSITQPQPVLNPLYINTNYGGLMMPSVPNTSQIVLLNQQSSTLWQAPANYISEQDIMSMPTVIVNDTSNTGAEKQKPILPKTAMPIIEVPNLSEYLDFRPKKLNSKPKKVDDKTKKGLKNVIYPVSAPKSSPLPEKSGTDSRINRGNVEKKLPDLTQQVNEVNKTDPTVKTPPPLETTRKSTPKSGSHIRTLNFSTPPKVSTHTKSNEKHSKTTQFVHKKQAAKSLFSKEETKNKKPQGIGTIWDQDLRSIIPESSPRSFKRKARKKVKKAKLNTTAQDAALLEAALQTPVKNVFDNPKETKEAAAEETTMEIKQDDPENKNGSENNIKRNITNVNESNKKQNSCKVETLELSRDSSKIPMKANRNIIPMLETPLKEQIIPKTPGIQTPGVQTPGDHNMSMTSNFTPITKMLAANLKGIDIDSIPTPSIAITPGFHPFTPNVDMSTPYSNRPTDYSTSSSYYLPSDNEQNKSLEAHLKEEEKKPTVGVHKEDNHLNIFNKNVIGKKNLSLMKHNISSSPSSSSDSSSDKDDSWADKGSNDTIIFNKKNTPRNNYSLRTRKVPEETEKKNSKGGAKPSDKTKTKDLKKEKTVKTRRTSNEKRDNNKKEVSIKKTKGKSEEKLLEVEPSTVNEEIVLVSKEEKMESIVEIIKGTTKVKKPAGKKYSGKAKVELVEKQIQIMHGDNTNTISEVSHDEKQMKIEAIDDGGREMKTPDEKKDERDRKKTNSEEKQFMAMKNICEEKATMLEKLEEKRQRTIKAMKDSDKESGEQSKPQRSHKFKIKPIPNLTCRKKVSPRKSSQSKKIVQPKKSLQVEISEKRLSVLHSDLYDSDESEDNISLRLSPCGDDVKPHINELASNEKTEPSVSDVEAQNLIEGLKERGIHLMHNRSPKKKIDGAPQECTTPEKQMEKEEALMNNHSSSQIDTLLRETYDNKLFVGENLHIVFDDSITKPIEHDSGRFKDPISSFIGKVYLEELGGEIDVLLKFTDSSILLDIPPVIVEPEDVKIVESSKKIVIQEVYVINENKIAHTVQEESAKSCMERRQADSGVVGTVVPKEAIPAKDYVIDDELMDFAATGTDELKTSPKSAKKRKLSEDGRDHTENKAKRILKRLDVDQFLNNIHADTNFHMKK